MIQNLTYEEFISNLKTIKRGEDCPITKSLKLLQGKWTARILFELNRSGSCRFLQLKRSIPSITNTMLTSTLRELEQQGLIIRQQFNEIPPHVEYTLSESGLAFLPIFYELGRWGERFLV